MHFSFVAERNRETYDNTSNLPELNLTYKNKASCFLQGHLHYALTPRGCRQAWCLFSAADGH